MPKCSRCPIKKECNEVGMTLQDKEGKRIEKACLILVMARFVLDFMGKNAEKKGEQLKVKMEGVKVE